MNGNWKQRLVLASATLVLVMGAAGDLRAEDWPQWRGPERNGISSEQLPDPWPEQLPQLWRVEVGAGHSGPVVSGDRVVSFSRQGEEEVVSCLDAATGKQLWRAAYAAPYTPAEPAKPHGQGPFATPAVSGGKTVSFGISGMLSCFDLAGGEQLWQKDYSKFNPSYPEWGAASSPLINDKHCIAAVGGKEGGAVVALAMDTGEEAWTLPLQEGPAYASPFIASIAGARTLVVVTRSRALGLDPASGTLLWQQEFTTGYEMNIVDPLPAGKTIILSGFRHGTSAYALGGEEGPQQLWHADKVSGYMSSPIRDGEHLYLLSQEQGGVLRCLAVSDGSVAWSAEDEKLGRYASIIKAGKRLLVQKTDGEMLIVAVDPAAFTVLARSKLSDSAVWAHPALAGGRLFIKDESHLTAFSLTADKKENATEP